MGLLPRLKLRGRILAGLLLCAVILGSAGAVAISSLRRIHSQMGETSQRLDAAMEQQQSQAHLSNQIRQVASTITGVTSPSDLREVELTLASLRKQAADLTTPQFLYLWAPGS